MILIYTLCGDPQYLTALEPGRVRVYDNRALTFLLQKYEETEEVKDAE